MIYIITIMSHESGGGVKDEEEQEEGEGWG
jgi:hypothetical protein